MVAASKTKESISGNSSEDAISDQLLEPMLLHKCHRDRHHRARFDVDLLAID
tara:strand:- start:724 stop:879 length:156 start_codon:yes stop_codon:yes gene_type:complete